MHKKTRDCYRIPSIEKRKTINTSFTECDEEGEENRGVFLPRNVHKNRRKKIRKEERFRRRDVVDIHDPSVDRYYDGQTTQN